MDSGNSFAGLYGVGDEGKARAAFLMKQYGKMGYKVVAVGIRDLDLPLDFLKKEAAKNGLLLIGANVYKDLKRIFRPYVIENVGGVKIAFIGIVDNSTNKYRPKKDFVIEDPNMELKELKDELAKERPDLVVLLTDIPAVTLKKMVMDLDWIEVAILSGRGSALRNPLEAGGTHILSPVPKGKGIGLAKIELSKKGDIVNISNNLIFLKKNVPEDKGVAKEVKMLVSTFHKKKIHTTKNPFLRALEEARKRRQRAHAAPNTETKGLATNATGTNPFLEIFKKGASKEAGTATSN